MKRLVACGRCGNHKERSEFKKVSVNSNGLKSYCNVCAKGVKRNGKYKKSVEKRLKEKLLYYKRFPQCKVAHHAIKNAVYRGKIIRDCCEVCGVENTHAHHDDYAKPLEVKWFCVEHHLEYHKVYGVGKNRKLAALADGRAEAGEA